MAQIFGYGGFLRFLGYHHFLMILLLTIIIVFSIILAGCTSTFLTNVYLLSLSYTNSTTPFKIVNTQINPNASTTFRNLTGAGNGAQLEVRVGYMGLCMSQASGLWVCSTKATTLANLLKTQFNVVSGTGLDPLNLIWIADKFKDEVVFNGLIFTGIPLSLITLLLVATFPGWQVEIDGEGSEQEIRPFPSRPLSQTALGIIAITSIFLFISAFWQHIAASAGVTLAQSLSYGTVKGHIGTIAMVLGWLGVLLSFVVTIGLLILILSIRVLHNIVDVMDE